MKPTEFIRKHARRALGEAGPPSEKMPDRSVLSRSRVVGEHPTVDSATGPLAAEPKSCDTVCAKPTTITPSTPFPVKKKSQPRREALAKSFGAAVKARRLSLSLSQEGLARRSGVKKAYISWMENGNANVTLRTISTLASALKVTPASLLE